MKVNFYKFAAISYLNNFIIHNTESLGLGDYTMLVIGDGWLTWLSNDVDPYTLVTQPAFVHLQTKESKVFYKGMNNYEKKYWCIIL